jgi:hypothetical protein
MLLKSSKINLNFQSQMYQKYFIQKLLISKYIEQINSYSIIKDRALLV